MLAEFKEKSVYGNVLYYPHNDVATKFATLLGKKTFSYSDIFNISQLGFETIIHKLLN
jgi:hypothetical protein